MSAVFEIADICDAIETTLSAATGLSRSQSYDELTDGMNDTPTLQVYPESGGQDVTTNNDRTAFRAGVQQEEVVIHADVYVRQRSHLADDMSLLVTQLDAIRTVLKAQQTKSFFGTTDVKAFAWTWQRVTFVYSEPQQPFVGIRFILRIRMF